MPHTSYWPKRIKPLNFRAWTGDITLLFHKIATTLALPEIITHLIAPHYDHRVTAVCRPFTWRIPCLGPSFGTTGDPNKKCMRGASCPLYSLPLNVSDASMMASAAPASMPAMTSTRFSTMSSRIFSTRSIPLRVIWTITLRRSSEAWRRWT